MIPYQFMLLQYGRFYRHLYFSIIVLSFFLGIAIFVVWLYVYAKVHGVEKLNVSEMKLLLKTYSYLPGLAVNNYGNVRRRKL